MENEEGEILIWTYFREEDMCNGNFVIYDIEVIWLILQDLKEQSIIAKEKRNAISEKLKVAIRRGELKLKQKTIGMELRSLINTLADVMQSIYNQYGNDGKFNAQ